MEGKFGKDRLVLVSPGLAERLRRYATALDRERDLGQAFFPKPDGRHYDKRTVYGVFRGLLREAGIAHGGRGCMTCGTRLPCLPSVHPHKLRHSKAMHLLQAGNPMVVIQAVLGHADVRTSSLYARADVEMTRAALEKASAGGPTRPSLPSWQANPGLMEWLRSPGGSGGYAESDEAKVPETQDPGGLTRHNNCLLIRDHRGDASTPSSEDPNREGALP